MLDLAGAGRSGIVTDKVAKSAALDQQVWQMSDLGRIRRFFVGGLGGKVSETPLVEGQN